MKFVLLIFFSNSIIWAQSFSQDADKIQKSISEKEVENYLKKLTDEGLSGSFLIPFKDELEDCEEDKDKPLYEVILVAESNPQLSKYEILPGQRAYHGNTTLKNIGNQLSSSLKNDDLSSSAVLERARALLNTYSFGFTQVLDPNSQRGREVVIESLVLASSQSNLSEKELTNKLSETISDIYKNDEEKFNSLSALSLRLYRSYNDARNPGYNNSNTNPMDKELPSGDLTLNQLMKGAAEFNEFQSGICNDISEAVAMIGEKMFPDKDVLTINAGTHFGVLVTDGKNHRVIDGGDQLTSSNKILLDPKFSSSNIRISKVIDGIQKEIAVSDTEMGQATEAAFNTGKKLLKTDADISTVVTHLKRKNFGVGTAVADLSESKAVIVVAKYEKKGRNWKNYAGAGVSGEFFDTDLASKYQIHIRAGIERSLFRYVHSNAELKFFAGTRLAGAYTVSGDQGGPNQINALDISGSIDLYQRAEVNINKNKPDAFQVTSVVEVEQSFGPKNWGETTGILSKLQLSDTDDFLKNTTFHLNQINADLNVQKKISPTLTGQVHSRYQGSNIGQSVSLLGGLDIKVPRGVSILVFSGYSNNDISGFKTKHGLLGNPSGPQAGVKVKTKDGKQIGATVIGVDGKGFINGSIKLPLNGKKKRNIK